jgi:hypothetical protein
MSATDVFEITAACHHRISPERDDAPPCETCGACEACCPHYCPVCLNHETACTCPCALCGEASYRCGCEEE